MTAKKRGLRVTDRRSAITSASTEAGANKIRKAGGLSKMSEEERGQIKFKTVVSGRLCNDLPKSLRAAQIACGNVAEE